MRLLKTIPVIYVIIAAAVIVLLAMAFRSKNRKTVSIPASVLFLKLGSQAKDFIADDEVIYTSQGVQVERLVAENLDEVKKRLQNRYNIVHIYAGMDGQGKVSFRNGQVLMADVLNLVQQAGGIMTIIATDNTGEAYIAGSKHFNGHMNVVMTLDRKNGAFVQYFKLIFSDLFAGKTLAATLAKYSGHNSQKVLPEAPDTFMRVGTAHISFTAA